MASGPRSNPLQRSCHVQPLRRVGVQVNRDLGPSEPPARGTGGRPSTFLTEIARQRWPLAFIAVSGLVCFRRLLGAGTFFRIDFHQTFEPLRTILGEALRNGLPLWDRHLNNGTPLLANPMHAAMYPPNLLFGWFAGGTALSVLTALHVCFGACGTILLCGRYGLRRSSAGLAGVAFGFSGFTLSAIPYANLSWSLAWLPWLIYAWMRTVDAQRSHRGWGIAGLATAFACMLTLAEPIILLAGMLGILLHTCERAGHPRSANPRDGIRALIGLPTFAAVVAVIVVSPFLVAFLGYHSECERASGFDSGAMMTWSMHPLLSLGAVIPNIYGDPAREGVPAFWAKDLEPTGHLLFAGQYVSGLLLALAAIGALARRRHWALTVWLFVMALLALGRWGPVYPLFASLPLMNLIRFPIKWCLVAVLPLSLLSALGLDWVLNQRDRGRKVLLFLLLLLALVPAFVSASAMMKGGGWLLALSDEAGVSGTPLGDWIVDRVLRAAIRTAVPLALAGLILIAARGRDRWIALGLPALLAVDLLTANSGLAQTAPSRILEDPPPAIRAIRADPGLLERVYFEAPMVAKLLKVPPATRRIDLAVWERAAVVGYSGASYGLDLAFNIDVGQFRSLKYARLHSMVLTAPMRPKLMLLGAAGATHLVTYGTYRGEYLEQLGQFDIGADRPQEIARNLLAVPRARMVSTLLPYDGDQEFMRTVDGAPPDLFFRTALVERGELVRAGIPVADLTRVDFDVAPIAPGEATVIEDRGGLVTIRVSGDGGYLILNDTWTDAWQATVDGADVPVFLADYAFRGVEVRAGRHEIRFRCGLW